MDQSTDDQWPRLTRRGFLAGTIAAALAACSSDGSESATTSPPTSASGPSGTEAAPTTSEITDTVATTVSPAVTSDPFTLGVASGDPLADSVILWTRLLPAEPLPEPGLVGGSGSIHANPPARPGSLRLAAVTLISPGLSGSGVFDGDRPERRAPAAMRGGHPNGK